MLSAAATALRATRASQQHATCHVPYCDLAAGMAHKQHITICIKGNARCCSGGCSGGAAALPTEQLGAACCGLAVGSIGVANQYHTRRAAHSHKSRRSASPHANWRTESPSSVRHAVRKRSCRLEAYCRRQQRRRA